MKNNTYGSKNVKIKRFDKLSQEEFGELFKKYQIQQSEIKCAADYVLELKQKIQTCKVALEKSQFMIKEALDMIEE